MYPFPSLLQLSLCGMLSSLMPRLAVCCGQFYFGISIIQDYVSAQAKHLASPHNFILSQGR